MARVLISLASLSMPPFECPPARCSWEDLGQPKKRMPGARDSGLRAFVEWARPCQARSAFCSVWRMGEEGEGDRHDGWSGRSCMYRIQSCSHAFA